MRPKQSDGSTYIDSHWGYVMEKHNGKWVRQHRLRMERKIGRKLKRHEVVHHKNGNRADNRLSNLELMTNWEHRSLHGKERVLSEAAKKKMSASAKEVANRPGERKRRSIRAKRQHRQKNFGAHTWRPK